MKLKKLKAKIITLMKNRHYLKYYYKKPIQENNVLIESKQGEDLAGNMFYTLKEISQNHKSYQVFLVATPEKEETLSKLLKKHELDNVKIVIHNSFEYFEKLATCKYLFNDTSFPMTFTKREGQVYTNTWHGTPLKQMGKDVVNRRYAIGNVKRNFMFADYLVYPNDEMKDKMLSSYGLKELYNGTILNAGYPRNAVFFDRESEKNIRKKLKLEGKQVIVYMPTWRGLMTKKKQDEQFKEIIDLMRYMEENLRDDQVFYVKMHVLVQKDLKFGDFKHIKSFPTGMETYEVLNIALSNSDAYVYLTLRQFQYEEVETVKVLKSLNYDIAVGKNYEFTFEYSNENIEDNIKSIFNNATLTKIVETDKQGLDQIQDSIN